MSKSAWFSLFSILLLSLSYSRTAYPFALVSQWVIPSRIDTRFENLPLERTKPIIVGDILYFANLSGEVYAVHRTQGYVFWKIKMPAPVDGALTYGRSRLYVGDTQGNLVALHARDGSEAWRIKAPAQWLSPPYVSKDKVYAFSSSEELFVLSESTGKEVWHYTQRGDEKMTVLGGAGPLVSGAEVFQGFADGHLVALNAQNGKVLWNKKLRTRARFHDVDMSPYVTEKYVLVATYDGKLYKLDRLSGDILWVFPVGSYGGFYAEGNRLYFAGLNGQIHCVDFEAQTSVWKSDFEGGVGLTPTKVGNYLVVTTSGDPAIVLDAETGKRVGAVSLGAGTLAAPVSAPDGWFYTFSNYGVLYSFEVKDSVPALTDAPETVPTPSALHRYLVDFNGNKKAPG